MAIRDTVVGVQVVESAPLPPGACFLTGRPDGPYVDTLVDVDPDTPPGRIYLSRQIVLDMATAFGALGPEPAARLRAERDELAVRVEMAEAELAGLQSWQQTVLSRLSVEVAEADQTDPKENL